MAHISLTPRRASPAFALSLTLAISACGGGGGSDGDTTAPTDSGPAPLLVAAAPTDCVDSSCHFVQDVTLDNDGNASLQWRVFRKGTPVEWRIAAHVPGTAAIGPAASLPPGGDDWQAKSLALGKQRIAVVARETAAWTSVVVDLSPASGPTVTPRVTLPVASDSQFIATLHDGVFVVGPWLQRGTLDLGGGATAQVRPIALPNDHRGQHWSLFEPLWGAPSAWWAFSTIRADSTERRVNLALVRLESGVVREGDDHLSWPWRTREVNDGTGPWCGPSGRPQVILTDYGAGRAAVAWNEAKPDAPQRCEVVVNGTALSAANANAAGLPALAGSASGPVALWQEYVPAQTGQGNSVGRIVWRALDSRTGVWSEPTQLSTHPHAEITGTTSAPDGLMAISWIGCDGTHDSRRCTGYLTKYVRGVWTTVEMGTRSPHSPYDNTQLAINIHGDAIVLWANSLHDGCQSGQPNSAKPACARIYAHRF
jgi:hypothetical protein